MLYQDFRESNRSSIQRLRLVEIPFIRPAPSICSKYGSVLKRTRSTRVFLRLALEASDHALETCTSCLNVPLAQFLPTQIIFVQVLCLCQHACGRWLVV